jgi:hypothetical protein
MSYEFMRSEMKRIGEERDAENAAELVVRLAKTPEEKTAAIKALARVIHNFKEPSSPKPILVIPEDLEERVVIRLYARDLNNGLIILLILIVAILITMFIILF